MMLAAGVVLLCGLSVAAAAGPGRCESFDDGWRFRPGDAADAQSPDFADADWQTVDLPHDWSVRGPFDRHEPAAGNNGYLPTGVGWYRKTFTLPPDGPARRTAVRFDGVYERSEVWINGRSVGQRPYGYSSFVYDLTTNLRPAGQANVIAVRVDNSAQPNSRWYTGSGIYRHTWLLRTDPLHVPEWGTCVTTPTVDADAATVHAVVQVRNDRTSDAPATLRLEILDPDGHVVATAEAQGAVASGGTRSLAASLSVPRPRVWSDASPRMYTLRSRLGDGKDMVDTVDTPFGIRTAVFDVDRGFLLNGRPVKLNGVCLHHDGGGVGAAVPIGVWERRLDLLKQMGCNAIRTSHNPPAPEFLDLCDRTGFLVMDEAFDEWRAGKRPQGYHVHFDQNWRRDLVDFVRRDRNHPSVVLWSAGNENYEQSSPDGESVLKPIVDAFHAEDPTRPVTAGCDRVDADPERATPTFLGLLDVVGYNYVDRWHDLPDKYYAPDRRAFPQRKFVGTESTSTAGVRGEYGWLFRRPGPPPAEGGFPAMPHASRLLDVEQLWKFVRTNDYVSGDFMWTGFDYLGEARWPDKVAPFGALDTCGFKKDGFYFYQSQWTTTPMIHLFPHWNWAGREGETIPVTCYTNCDTVELFLNGKSLGLKGYAFPRAGMEQKYGHFPTRAFAVRTTSDLHLSWDVPYAPGTLKAVGTVGDRTIVEELATTGAPAAIRLTADKAAARADGRDVVHVTVEIVDDAGRVVPTAADEISFDLTGPARLLCVDSGDPASDEPFVATRRRAFHGMALAVVQTARGAGGDVRLTARADGLKAGDVTVPSGK